MSHPQQLVQKLWKHRNILRDDDLSSDDCAGQKRIALEVERRLSVLEELSVLVSANLQSVLDKVFSGELAV